MGPFQGAPGHIRQKQAGRLRLLALRKEAILDPCLGPRQPSQILIESIFIKLPFYQFRRPFVAVSPYFVNLVDFFDSFSVRLL